jgi:hypothetical protein
VTIWSHVNLGAPKLGTPILGPVEDGRGTVFEPNPFYDPERDETTIRIHGGFEASYDLPCHVVGMRGVVD